MKLYEFEAKNLLKSVGINIPKGKVANKVSQKFSPGSNVIGKAQVLHGGRGKKGLITKDYQKLFKLPEVEKVLIEEYIDCDELLFVSITYDTVSRSPVILFSENGGIDIEENQYVKSFSVNLLDEHLPKINKNLDVVIEKLWKLFKQIDARLVEINPLGKIGNKFIALDAKIILDDDALFRHEEFGFEPRSELGRKPTENELQASLIDKDDHRGSAGSSYFDFDGDIAVIAAGGGGSVVNMDALIALGGKPANYTEHSGNPPAEKVEKLTKVVLSKPNLAGVWFVGATANFTDMVETLNGFVKGLRTIKPKPAYPIVVRRGGPRWEEAKEMLENVKKNEGFNFHIYGPETPMTSTAKILVDLVKTYKRDHD
jgi:citryl-CoA synthetase large subunit